MASKELVAQVEQIIWRDRARVIPSRSADLANEILSTILAAQNEHIKAEADGYIENFRTMDRINAVHVTRALAMLKRRLIDESPLGEQSE
ncbi:hypothetical protein OIV19_20420 [Brucella sp. HL-2]|nr:hypothetical protein [Brucella sp. HL-2]MCV9909967.1 hypothetical protein [Brucella sp. HL-2]